MLLLLSSISAQISPTNVSASAAGPGTNLISWSTDSTSDYDYQLFCYTAPITAANIISAWSLASGLRSNILSFTHILADFPQTDLTNSQTLYYAVLSRPLISADGHILATNSGGGWRKTVFGYETSIWTLHDLYQGGNKSIELDMKYFGTEPDWSKIGIRIDATNIPGYEEIQFSDYSNQCGGFSTDWKHISIPAVDLAAVDWQNVRNVQLPYSFDGGDFELGIDEVIISGGPAPILYYGDDHAANPFDNNSGGITHFSYTASGGALRGGTQQTVAETTNTSAAAAVNAVPPPALSHFTLSYSSFILTNRYSEVIVTAWDTYGSIHSNFSGTVILDTDGTDAQISWQIVSALGSADTSVPGQIAYTFVPADNGSVVLEIMNQVIETVLLSAVSGLKTDDGSGSEIDFIDDVFGLVSVNITFSSPPSSVTISKAALKYNKDFAVSFSFDDRYMSAYMTAYPLLNGGTTAHSYYGMNDYMDMGGDGMDHSGLFYTDGCGNDIPFRAGCAIYSWNENTSQPLHIYMYYMKWYMIRELYDAGWDMLNHSWSHDDTLPIDFDFEITNNSLETETNCGFSMTHFVLPTGHTGYIPFAFSHGYKAVYSGGIGSIPQNVTAPLNLADFQGGRNFIYDSIISGDLHSRIDNADVLSTGGANYWIHEGTHSCGQGGNYGASLTWTNFRTYMEYIEQNHGKSGSDNAWVAGPQEVYEYLAVRDDIILATNMLSAAEMRIDLDLSSVPPDLRRYALSLLIDADSDIINVTTSGIRRSSYNGTAAKKLINLEWGPEIQTNTPANYFPDAVITSHTNGQLVTGTINLQVSCSDSDGTLQYVRYSTNDRWDGAFIPMNGSQPSFNIDIDTTTMADGTNIIYVMAMDDRMHVNWMYRYRQLTLIVDNNSDLTPPAAIQLSRPTNMQFVTNNYFTFTWNSAWDPSGISHYILSSGGINYQVSAAMTNLFLSGLADGVYTNTIRAVDNASNTSAPSSEVIMVIDAGADQVQLISPLPFAIFDTDSLMLDWQDISDFSGIVHYELELDGSVIIVTNSILLVTGMSNGSHSWRVRVLDGAGHYGEWSGTYSFEIVTVKIGESYRIIPNPFNPNKETATIHYDPELEGIEFVIHSLSGEKINVITGLDGRAVWDGSKKDGSQAPVGSYLVSIRQRGDRMNLHNKIIVIYK